MREIITYFSQCSNYSWTLKDSCEGQDIKLLKKKTGSRLLIEEKQHYLLTIALNENT